MLHAIHLVLVLAAASHLPPSVVARSEAEVRAVAEAEALDAQGQQAEQHDDFAAAVGFYKQALKASPGTPVAKFANERIDWLEMRSEDGYRPLIALTKEKRILLLKLTRPELERFEQVVDGFPYGAVRREARAWVAERWLRTIRDPANALRAHKKWLDEPGLDDTEKMLAKAGLDQAEKNAEAAQHPRAASPQSKNSNPVSGDRPSLARVRRIGDLASAIMLVLAGLAAAALRRQRPGRVRTAGVLGAGLVACGAIAFLIIASTTLLDPVLRSIGQ